MSGYNESSNEAQLPSAGGIEQQSSKFFPESNIMKDNKHLESVLNKWYGNDKQSWRLVYRASDNNHSAAAFHENCDGIAPLYVIALGSDNIISGGFTDVAYTKTTRKGGFIQSERAFLFTLSSPQPYFQRTKFDIVKKENAICYQKFWGPIFGADLLISNGCNSNMESFSNLPASYDGPNATFTTLFGSNNFNIQDYEVFTLANDH